MDEFDKLFKTHEQIKDDIVKDFAVDLVNEINKLIVKYGKENLKKMIKDN